MTDWEQRRRRKNEVRARAARPNDMYKYCRVTGCAKPARAGTSDGLDMRFCRAHAEQYQRHGSPYQKSYLAKMLAPYRKAALIWLIENAEAFWTKKAVLGIEGLYAGAGQHIEAFRLRGLGPRQRASAHWARLREHGVDPRLPVAAWLAVEMILADDTQAVSTVEFKRVQAAKIVHRMASGTHKRWEYERKAQWSGMTAPPRVEEMHVYPRSRGRVLRHIGEDLETDVELLVHHHLDDVCAFKHAGDQRNAFRGRANPKGVVARRRAKGARQQ